MFGKSGQGHLSLSSQYYPFITLSNSPQKREKLCIPFHELIWLLVNFCFCSCSSRFSHHTFSLTYSMLADIKAQSWHYLHFRGCNLYVMRTSIIDNDTPRVFPRPTVLMASEKWMEHITSSPANPWNWEIWKWAPTSLYFKGWKTLFTIYF